MKRDSAKRKDPTRIKYPLLLAAEFLQLPFSTCRSALKGQAAQVLVTAGHWPGVLLFDCRTDVSYGIRGPAAALLVA